MNSKLLNPFVLLNSGKLTDFYNTTYLLHLLVKQALIIQADHN